MRIQRLASGSVLGLGLVVSVLLAVTTLLVVPQPAEAACAAMPKDKGQVTFSIDIPMTGTYRIWSRIYAPTASANGFYMQIDQTVCKTVVGNGGPIAAGKFTWVNWTDGDTNKIFSANLEKGKHTIVAAGLDANLSLDKVMFLTETTCTPVDTGTNCDWMSESGSPTPSTSVSPGAGQASPTPDANGNIPASSSNSSGSSSGQKTKSQDLVAGLVKYWPWVAGGAVLLLAAGGAAWYWRKKLFTFGSHATVGAPLAGATSPGVPQAGTVVQPQPPKNP